MMWHGMYTSMLWYVLDQCLSPRPPGLANFLFTERVIDTELRKCRADSSLLSIELLALRNRNARRVFPAVIRLTVYRGLQVRVRQCAQ